jgi:catechol 2,3-dioxygenase-like lactoylglutathione lyase family enzyme
MTLSLAHVAFDAADATALAAFWAGVVGAEVDDGATEHFASVGLGRTAGPFPTLLFLHVPEPPRAKNRVHLDLVADDRAAEVARLVGLGATAVGDFDEYGAVWTTLADPEGNLFDVAQG